MSAVEWPTARLTTIARARALAAAVPGAGYAETGMAVPFAQAWRRLADLERSVPGSDPLVQGLRIRSRRPVDGAEELGLLVRGWPGLPLPMTARLEEGFCLMRAPGGLYLVVMAAAPDPDDPSRTRYAHVEAVPRQVGRPFRGLMRRMVANDVGGFRRYVEG
jgi:hypothetical protein